MRQNLGIISNVDDELHVSKFNFPQHPLDEVLDAGTARRKVAIFLSVNLIANYLVDGSTRSNGVDHLLGDAFLERFKITLENVDVTRAVVCFARLVGVQRLANVFRVNIDI